MADVSSTTAANLIPSRWSASLRLDATEEMMIAKNFNEGEGVERINGTLYIRRVKAVAAAAQSGGTISYTANTENRIAVTPTWATAGVQIDRNVFTQMDQSPANPYRRQIALGLGAYIDVQAGLLATSLSTNISGGGANNLDYATIADAVWKVIASSKNHFKAGETPAWFTIHPSQGKFLVAQMNLIADYIRGDGETPVATGWILKALGANMKESGNVYQAAGVTHNLMHTADAYVLAYNEEPLILPEQQFDVTTKIIGTTEFGVAEVYDEYAADVQSAA
jgi:hypothetical protein